MGRLDKRIEALDKRYQTSPGEPPEDREEREAALRATFRRAEEKAQHEEEEGNTRRRAALNELMEFIERGEREAWEA